MQEKEQKNIHISEFSLRIEQLRQALDLNNKDFAESLGIGKGRLSNIVNGRNNPDAQFLANISKRFTNVNLEWLLSGKGEILKNKSGSQKFENYSNGDDIGELKELEDSAIEYNSRNQFVNIGNGYYQMLVPFIEDYAYAGYLSGYSNDTYLDELPLFPTIVKKQHRGIYRSIRVKGDSMDDGSKDSICERDIVIGRKVDKQYWKSKLHISKWENFIIVHDGGIVIKNIIDHDVDAGIITCKSINPDKEFYPNFKLHLKDVYELYNIVQIVKLRD